jgi:tetratricopeptide (TPR) repeat protein
MRLFDVFDEAARHYKITLPIYRRAFGPISREVAAVLHNLGGLEHARGRFARGEPPAREAVLIARRLLPSSDPERVAHEVAHAALLDGLGRQRESIPTHRRALMVFTRHYGCEHYEVASTLQNLAAAEHVLGRARIAEKHYLEACELLVRVRGRGDPELALNRYNLALLYRDTGRPVLARDLLKTALAALRRRLGDDHPTTRSCAEALATLATLAR